MYYWHWCRSTIRYLPSVEKPGKIRYNIAEYVRKNKITDSRTIDEKIKRVRRRFPKYIQEYINNTPVEIIGKGKNNHYLNGKLYLLNDVTEEEIIHEIGHIIEEKLDIVNDKKYQTILKDSIGKIDVFNNTIGPIDGYDSNKYEFLLSGDKFISDYQRRVYNIDINKKDRIDYLHGTFNYNVFRDYLPEGLRCYMIDRKLLKIKNIELYKQTDIYQEFKESIMSHEKQNEAVFDIIHWQIIDRSKFEDITKQMHLLSYMDRLAVVIMMASTKIPQVYIEGCFHYTSDVKATHSDTVIGASYYEDFFANKGNNNFNVPFKDGSYISRIKINGEFSYIESNGPFDNMEIGVLNHIAKTFEDAYIAQEKQLKSWLEEQKK